MVPGLGEGLAERSISCQRIRICEIGTACWNFRADNAARVEAGDVWADLDPIDAGNLKYGGSIFLGADIIIGPLYLGVGAASGSEGAVYLQLNPVLRSDRQTR